jgi:hypothetical protein
MKTGLFHGKLLEWHIKIVPHYRTEPVREGR